jgi:hypothetical protein
MRISPVVRFNHLFPYKICGAMDCLISEELAKGVGEQLRRMNRGYWTDL